MTTSPFNIRFSILKFSLLLTENCILSENKESALRGGIGEMLLRQYCFRDRNCETCSFSRSCIAQNFMYSKYQIKPDFVTTGESLGFVLEADQGRRSYRRGDIVSFQLTLFGDTIAYLNPVIQAIHALGQSGLGEKKAHFVIQAIQNRRGDDILQNGSIFYKNYLIETISDYISERRQQLEHPNQIIFTRPLCLKYNGEFIQEFHMQAVINGVTRRIYMLNCLEGQDIPERKFSDELPEIVEQNVQYEEVKRYSSRKQQPIILKGISGSILVDHIHDELLDYLIAGEITHIGKNTRFGFGIYKIV